MARLFGGKNSNGKNNNRNSFIGKNKASHNRSSINTGRKHIYDEDFEDDDGEEYVNDPEYDGDMEYYEDSEYENEEYDEDSEYDEDEEYYEDSEYDEDEEYYEDSEYEDDEEYFDDAGHEDEDNLADGEYERDEAYLAGDEYAENEEYLPEEDYDEYEDEGYAADGEYDEDEEYQSAGDYVADEEYDEDEDEDDYYQDTEYDGEYDDERGNYRANNKSNFFRKVLDRLTNLSMVDHIVVVTGLGVLIVAFFAISFYMNAKNRDNQVAAFAEIGSGAEQISIIGERGLLAVADAQMARNMAAEFEDMYAEEEEEEEAAGDVSIRMVLSSIQKDLKIKFTNDRTGKLIANVSFEVKVTGPDQKSYSLTDDDKDGIIYQKDIAAGNYQVAMVENTASAEYNISTESHSIAVKDSIEYKKVDVSNEIKKESQVNAKAEDTKVNQTVVESVNVDTVEWVESTRTPISGDGSSNKYDEVSKSDVPEPGKTARADFGVIDSAIADVAERGTSAFFLLAGDGAPGEVPGENPSDKPSENPSEKPDPDPSELPSREPDPSPSEIPSEKPSETPSEKPSEKPSEGPSASPAVTPSVTPSPVPSPSQAPQPSPVASPSPTPTPTATPVPSPTATPNKAREDTKSKLKDKSGNQLYVKSASGNYYEAVYADYYRYDKFYKKSEGSISDYRYTGWQELDGKTYFFDKNGNKLTGEQIIQGARYNFASDGSLNVSSGHMGIDVSKWNGSINWGAVKNAGVSYVIIRCGYRGSSTGAMIVDPTYITNIKGASAAGIKVGVYFFTQATNGAEAVEEASMVLDLVKGYKISYPVFLDVEAVEGSGRANGISKEARTEVCRAFCQTIQNAGYTAGIYANKTWLTTHINTGSLTGYKIWLAQYAAKPTYSATRYDMWQYSSSGSISGISGRVDQNISYLGY